MKIVFVFLVFFFLAICNSDASGGGIPGLGLLGGGGGSPLNGLPVVGELLGGSGGGQSGGSPLNGLPVVGELLGGSGGGQSGGSPLNGLPVVGELLGGSGGGQSGGSNEMEKGKKVTHISMFWM
ncbi:UNVERIFIED_CONTAM: hypothetical protein RMT77_003992 [Armadillidium vulgare]